MTEDVAKVIGRWVTAILCTFAALFFFEAFQVPRLQGGVMAWWFGLFALTHYDQVFDWLNHG